VEGGAVVSEPSESASERAIRRGDRRSIEIEGLSHLTAIPVASRVGPLLASSVIAPFTPGTRDVPATVEEQLANIFHHIGAMLDAAGATWDDIVKVDVWLADAADRPALEPLWEEHFPDADSRPARHTHISRGAPMASADFLAYVEG
jgi:2-iminobutanoate/2-iminopropanoate deaminase